MCTEHQVARIFLMRRVCQEVLSGSHPSLTFHVLAWLKMKQCAFSKTVHTSRNMSYITPELTSIFSPCTRTPSYPSARPTSTSLTSHSSEINPCHDPQQASISCMADVRTITGYEPKDLAEKDDLCVKPLFFHRPRITWTSDSAGSIATSFLNRIWMMSKFVLCWLHHFFFSGETSKCGPITCYHSERENLVSSSSQVPKSTRKPVALFPRKRKSCQESLSDTEDFSSEHQQVQGNNDPPFRFSNPGNSMNSFCKIIKYQIVESPGQSTTVR